MITMLDLEETLMMYGFDVRTISKLPQSKSYLKIVRIPYISEKTNIWISLDKIENVLKNNYLFNNEEILSASENSEFLMYFSIF